MSKKWPIFTMNYTSCRNSRYIQNEMVKMAIKISANAHH
jgi:hypothetical protein